MTENFEIERIPANLAEMSDEQLRWQVENIRRGNSALAARLQKRLRAEADRRGM